MKIYELLDITLNSFRRIGLKSIVYEDSQKRICLFLVISFEIERNKDNLIEAYNRFLNAKGVKNVRLIESYLDKNQLSNIIDEINRGQITIDRIVFSLLSTPADIAKAKFEKIEKVNSVNSPSHFIFRETLDLKSPLRFLNDLNHQPPIYWMDMTRLFNFDISYNYNLIIDIPINCHFVIDYDQKQEITIECKGYEPLLMNSKLVIFKRNIYGGQPTYIDTIEVSKNQKGIWGTVLQLEIAYDEVFFCEMIHDKLGSLETREKKRGIYEIYESGIPLVNSYERLPEVMKNDSPKDYTDPTYPIVQDNRVSSDALQGLIDQINRLESTSYKDPDYNIWKGKVLRLVAQEFGDDHYKEIDKVLNPGVAVSVGNNDTYFQERQKKSLSEARRYLTSYLEELKNSHASKLVNSNNIASNQISNEIFIVHGHDTDSKHELEKIIREFKLDPIILNDKPNRGKTIIEKIESYSKNSKFAIVLLTPDDECKSGKNVKRARQNVIFELGYFIGHWGRDRVCCLYKSNLEIPSDLLGFGYYPFKKSVKECYRELRNELKDAGYIIE